MPENLLAPGAVLALWTLIMLSWAGVARFKAFSKAGIDLKAGRPRGRSGRRIAAAHQLEIA